MKKTTKILSIFMALLMVVSCIPMTAFAKDRDTSSLDAYLDNANLGNVVETLLTDLGKRAEQGDLVASALSICCQVIDALKKQAAESGVDVATADTEALAKVVLDYADKALKEANLDEAIKDYKSVIKTVLKTDVDLSSVDGIIGTLAGAIDFLNGQKNFGDAANLSNTALKTGSGRNQVVISRKNSKNLDVINAVFGFLSDTKNIAVIKKVVAGKLSLGNLNATLKTFGLGDVEAMVNDTMGNLDQTINELLYDNLLATKNAEGKSEPAYADSAYAKFTSDELLAAALIKLITGTEVSREDAQKVAKMNIYEIVGKYGDLAMANFAIEPLNTTVKTALNDLINSDANLAILKNIINLNYEFKNDTFNFADMSKAGLFANLNDIVVKIIEVIAQPAVYKELALKTGGNENLNYNLKSFFGFVLKTLASNNGGKLEFTISGVPYSFDFSQFTAANLAGKSLEDMVIAVLGIFYPTWFNTQIPADVNTLEKLAVYTAYTAIDKFMPDDFAFAADYKNLVFTNDGKVRDVAQSAIFDEIGTMGMDVAMYWLNRGTNIGVDQAQVKAYKAQGWTWEDFLEEIVDWAVNYIKGLPAVSDEITAVRGVKDGYGAWYKLNVILNDVFPLAIIKGCGDETFTFDTYTFVMKKAAPAIFDCDFASLAGVVASADDKNNPLSGSIISSVITIVDDLLFSLFEHNCGTAASFTKPATATHDGYSGMYDTANGHYIGEVKVTPKTGETQTDPVDPPTDPVDPPTDPVDPPTDPVKPAYTLGDVNGDGKINASDARMALRISAKLETPTEIQMLAADVNKDGKVNASDARKILRYSAKLETSFD